MQASVPNYEDAAVPRHATAREPANTAVHETITERIRASRSVLAAKAYGSSLYREGAVDFDTAVLVPSSHGVVTPGTYVRLERLRHALCLDLSVDVDLVPHTADEFDDRASPLWNPRCNPSLAHGIDIKGEFPISNFASGYAPPTAEDAARAVLHDNRTITRRQLLRTLEGESGRIYVSKLLHGPGNALTVHACRTGEPLGLPNSDLRGSLAAFDRAYGCDSRPANAFLDRCRTRLSAAMALRLMDWHERLFRVTRERTPNAVESYDWCCWSIGLTV